MQSDPPLLALQRNFFRALREPVFGGSRDLTSLPGRTGGVSARFAGFAKAEIRSTGWLDAHERLELYHRQYWFRLLDSIEEDFPALQHLLGRENFWRLIEAYLEQVPSRSFTLRHLGGDLADYLKINPGLAGGYPVHAIELAELEYAMCEIFEQPKLPAVPAEKLADVPLALQPHVRLFAFHTPADELWRLDASAEIPAELRAPPTANPAFYIAVFRHKARLNSRRLEPKAYSLLQSITETASVTQALESSDATANEVQRWFQSWTELGFLCERPVPAAPSKIEIKPFSSSDQPVSVPLHSTYE